KAYTVAPQELVRQGAAAIGRARAAVDALRALGLDQAAIDDLAARADTELTSTDNRDPAIVQETVLDELRARVGADKVAAAATAFSDSHPEPPGLFDLGDVSDQVAQQYGFGCATAPEASNATPG